jgi:macrolide transport system ATP-binding/permease protein
LAPLCESTPAIGRHRTLGTLSGGQRSRVALAALLVSRPTALLLDEPTNHLDDQAVAFVETQLRQLPGVVIVASHDRVCLDEVCTDIIDLDPRQSSRLAGDDCRRSGITRYGGGQGPHPSARQHRGTSKGELQVRAYSAYLDAKKAERHRREQAFARQQDEMNTLRHAIATAAHQVAHGRPPRDGNK